MADKVYIVGAYVASEDPALRLRVFVPLTAEFGTLEEAVAGAERDFRGSHVATDGLAFVVYTSPGGDAVVEVSRGNPFETAGFYKVVRVETGETDAG